MEPLVRFCQQRSFSPGEFEENVVIYHWTVYRDAIKAHLMLKAPSCLQPRDASLPSAAGVNLVGDSAGTRLRTVQESSWLTRKGPEQGVHLKVGTWRKARAREPINGATARTVHRSKEHYCFIHGYEKRSMWNTSTSCGRAQPSSSCSATGPRFPCLTYRDNAGRNPGAASR